LATFFYAHPYFFADLLGLAVVLAGFIVAGNQRQAMVIGGLGLVPLTPLAVLHQEAYWSPVRLTALPVGIEDVMFLFQTGAMAWLMSVWVFRRKLRLNPRTLPFLRRYAALAGVAGALVLVFWILGIEIMTASLATLIIISLAALALRPSLWPPAAAGAVCHTAFYFALVRFCFWVWPDFVSYWNPAHPWFRLVLGVPVGELAFALVVGGAYPLCVGYELEAVLDKRSSAERRAAARNEPN